MADKNADNRAHSIHVARFNRSNERAERLEWVRLQLRFLVIRARPLVVSKPSPRDGRLNAEGGEIDEEN